MHETKKMNALGQLVGLDLIARREKYPNAPLHAIAARRFNDRTANALTACILRWLELRGHKAWRQSSKGRYRPGQRITDILGRVRQTGGQWLKGQNNGQSDVACIIQGQFCAIEVKMKDRQSEAQKQYERDIVASGGLYAVVRTFDEFLKTYNVWTASR